MKKVNGFSALAVSIIAMVLGSNTAHANGTGISTFPLEAEKKVISTEMTGIVSSGGGVGLQARYTQKLNEDATADAGLGISGGERSARLFAGYDYQILPDYESQPRTSIKAFVENSKEYGSRRNILGFAPTLSKGFVFWDHEAFPYISFPYGISLDGSQNSYKTTLSGNIGVTGIIPGDYLGTTKKITASAEAVVGLKNSFSGVFLGFGYPIE
jgi:hypothetical protein